jgi:hypothetical protein
MARVILKKEINAGSSERKAGHLGEAAGAEKTNFA